MSDFEADNGTTVPGSVDKVRVEGEAAPAEMPSATKLLADMEKLIDQRLASFQPQASTSRNACVDERKKPSKRRRRIESSDSERYDESEVDSGDDLCCDAGDDQDDEGWCTDEDNEEGPELVESIAKYADARMTTLLSKSRLKVKLERLKMPKNSKFLKEVRINRNVFTKLPFPARKQDAKTKRVQKLMAKGMIAACRVAEFVWQIRKEDPCHPNVVAAYDSAFDAITLIGQASFYLNMGRVSFTYDMYEHNKITQRCLM